MQERNEINDLPKNRENTYRCFAGCGDARTNRCTCTGWKKAGGAPLVENGMMQRSFFQKAILDREPVL